MKTYGDKRQSQLVEGVPSVDLTANDFVPSEPITVVLSKAGWIRRASGHEIDPVGLSFRAGDEYLTHTKGKSGDRLVLLDDTGRSYGLDPNGLPSARGQGDPITSLLNLPAGARIVALFFVAPQNAQNLIVASSTGYGFATPLANLDTAQKAGKAIINLNDGQLLSTISQADDTLLAVANSTGQLLVFELSELPMLNKGKGNKLLNLKEKESIVAIAILSANDKLLVQSGKRTLPLTPSDIANYQGKRAGRGGALPKGFTNVSGLLVEKIAKTDNGQGADNG